MQSFKLWLIDEAAHVYGDPDYVPIHMRPDHARAVAQGIAAEDEMRRQMGSKGLQIEPSDDYEDRVHGIDGYLVMRGAREPVQIKRRTTTDEFAFEVAMDRTANGPQPHPLQLLGMWNGKDAKSEANLYVVRNVQGTQATIIRKQDAWRLIQQAVQNWVQILESPMLQQYPALARKYMNDFYNGGNPQGYGIKLKIIWDREKGVWKLMAYIRPNALPAVRQINMASAQARPQMPYRQPAMA